MRIITNPKKVQRYNKIGLYTSLASLVFLVAAVIMTLTMRVDLTTYSFIAMLIGLVLSQIGVYFANRWGKSPRIDERITLGLKGLDDRYSLYHYVTAVPHLLIGPAGIWVLSPHYQAGTITFEKNRYRQQGVGFFNRVVGQEGLGRPELDAQAFQQDFEKFLHKNLSEEGTPLVQSAIVFTSPKASVQAQDAPVPTMHVDKLKDFIRRKAKEEPARMEVIQKLEDLLPQEDVE
jgi:hypothetical protein